MKRSWTAIAVAFAAFFAATGCNDYGNTFQSNTGAFLRFVSPSNATAGGSGFTITLTGSGFVTQTIVTWNQTKLTTCVVTTTAANVCAPANDTGTIVSVTAVVPASMISKAGTDFVQTKQPHSGTGTNGLSNAVAFIVFPPPNPVPTITTIAPNSAPAGNAALPLTITWNKFSFDVRPHGRFSSVLEYNHTDNSYPYKHHGHANSSDGSRGTARHRWHCNCDRKQSSNTAPQGLPDQLHWFWRWRD